MAELIVTNTSPLIAFARMGALDVIGKLPFEFICPQQVKDEIAEGVAQGYPLIAPQWLSVRQLATPLSPLVLAGLDSGEAAVIQLALELGISTVCLDELKGRRAALAAGLQVVGSPGLLARARTLGLIIAARPLVEKAMSGGIFYHPDLVQRVLQALGE